MSAVNFRPVCPLEHPIGGRYNIPRGVEQGTKGDRSKSCTACGFSGTVESLFMPVAAAAPTHHGKKISEPTQRKVAEVSALAL